MENIEDISVRWRGGGFSKIFKLIFEGEVLGYNQETIYSRFENSI